MFSVSGLVVPEVLASYPESPTAQAALKAYNSFRYGWEIIINFIKMSDKQNICVQSRDDCKMLRPAFHSYLLGLIEADHMAKQFPIPGSRSLLTSYLNLCPDDALAEYLNFYMHDVFAASVDGKPSYQTDSYKIRWLENFIGKLCKLKRTETTQTLLQSAYYRLGAQFFVTHQENRALDSFQKCLDLDPSSLPALYAVGFTGRNINHKKSLERLQTFVERAPRCDEKYPNALYTIGLIYFNHYNDNNMAKLYYRKGKAAEQHRLPFNPPVKFDPKTILELFVQSEGELNWIVLLVLIIFACSIIWLII